MSSTLSILKLDKPLAFFDIESTGTNARQDRIIDLAIIIIMPDGSQKDHVFRVNPGVPIPPETTKIHGITDSDVKDSPPFREIAQSVADVLKDCDLAGYNIVRFDVPMLEEEFVRAGVTFKMDGRRLVDAQKIYHKREPRDLTAALSFYCGEKHTGAHDAMGDVLATIHVLEGQLKRYTDLPQSARELHEYCNPSDPTWVDSRGMLKWLNGEVVLNFSRRKDVLLTALMKEDPGFIKWILKGDFPRDTKDILQACLNGTWPTRPASIPPPQD